MIITQAKIGMAAGHTYNEQHQVSERMEFWLGERNPAAPESESASVTQTLRESVSLSQEGMARSGSLLRLNASRNALESGLDTRSRINLMVLMAFYEAVTGRRLQITLPGELPAGTPAEGVDIGLTPPDTAMPAQSSSSGFGLVYERREVYRESEKMTFMASGVIETADGRRIDISASLRMSREYYEESTLAVRAGNAVTIDPLVINFDGQGAQLSQTRFAFDIDFDGTPDQIAMLRPGSGYLALDRNGDGVINDGSELFGPATGQGFAELARYDEDGNGFIDEGDSIYNQLRIWVMNEDGSSQLMALGDKNIGAIFLGHVSTPFQLKDSGNQSLGEVVRSSIYLTEQGQVGMVQEIHLAV
jgi:hypothetical protein